jgi:hypothetical protein
MWNHLRALGAWLLPGLALGLFSGRIASEAWTNLYEPQIVVAVVITGLTTAVALLITRPHPLSATWPLLLLWGYILYPHPDPLVWTAVALLTAVCFAQMIPLPALPERWLVRAGLVGTAVLFGVLYFFTLAPGLLPADNGEFQLIAAQLGVAHPPGFPLYTMLAHLMTRLPVGETAAYRVNLLSVLTSTAVLLLVYQTVWDITKRMWAPVTAVIALGTATTFWAQATTANIRSLTALFAALALWALVRFYQQVQREKSVKSEEWRVRDRWLIVVALALGLGVSHHLSLAFMGALFLLFVVIVDPAIIKMPSRWLRPLLATLLGLLPLLYLPLRANAGVHGASPSLATWSGFVEHVLGLGFQGDFFYFTAPLTLRLRLDVMGNVLTFQFSGWLLAGMVIGLALLLWREWKLGLLFGLSFGIFTLITAMYRAPQTVEYMLPAYVPMVLCLGYAVGVVGQKSRGAEEQRSGGEWETRITQSLNLPISSLFTAIMFTAAIFQGWSHWPSYRQMHLVEDARDYAQPLLADAPPDALILANWHWATPLWYLQEIEGQRPDVRIQYVAPGAAAYGETWAQEIAAEWRNGRDVIATWYDPAAYASLPPPEPLHETFWFRQQPRTTLPTNFIPLDATLGETIQLLGYHLSSPTTEIWQEAILTLAWQSTTANRPSPISLNAHLIGPDGRSYAQSDLNVIPQPDGLTLTQFRLTPRPGAQPGDYAIRVGGGEESMAVTTLTVTPMSQPPLTQHRVYRGTNTLRLFGYDWDHTLPELPRLYLHWQTADGYVAEVRDGADVMLPPLAGPWGVSREQWKVNSELRQQYVPLGGGIVWAGDSISNLQSPISPGKSYPLPQHFVASFPLWRDYIVSTRLAGYEADGFHWAWCDLVDYVPAMGAIPTLKWIGGSSVTSPHIIDYTQGSPVYKSYCQSAKPAPGAPVLAVSETAVPGQTVGGMVTLYEAFTQRPLPILDERITAQFPWIPLGSASIHPVPAP